MITHTFVQIRPASTIQFFGEAHPDKFEALKAYQAGNPHIASLSTSLSTDGLVQTSLIAFKTADDSLAYFKGMPTMVLEAYTTERTAYNTANGIVLKTSVA